MFRKLYLAIAGGVALVAFMGLASQALAVNPSCSGPPGSTTVPYDNTTAIHDFTIDTPDSKAQFKASGVSGGALVCGTALTFPSQGLGTIYERADITVPPGVKITDTAPLVVPLTAGKYVGHGTLEGETIIFGAPVFVPATAFNMRIRPKSECLTQNIHKTPGGLVPAGSTIIACYKAASPALAQNWNAAHEDASGNITLTIGKVQSVTSNPYSLEKLTLDLCSNVGPTKAFPIDGTCGASSDPVVQKNGKATTLRNSCKNTVGQGAKGEYGVTSTQNNGTVAGPEFSCVDWKPFLVAF